MRDSSVLRSLMEFLVHSLMVMIQRLGPLLSRVFWQIRLVELRSPLARSRTRLTLVGSQPLDER
jgi:hypothetical protein